MDTVDIGGRLRAFVEKIERLDGQKEEFAVEVRESFAEAKGAGFDVPALKRVLRLRKMERNAAEEHEAIVETYKKAIGI